MFDLEPQEARLLLDIALMATGQNRFEIANVILLALKAYRPHAEALSVAEAVLLLSRGATEEALAFIEREQRADRFPESAMLNTFKGMAYLKMERPQEACLVLAEAAATTQDPAAIQLARELLESLS